MMMIRSSSFNNSSISVCWLLSAFFLSLLLLNTRNTIAFSYHPITKTTTTLLRRSNNNRQQQWKNQQLLSSPSQRTELQYSSYNSNNQIRSRPLSINTVTQGRKMKSTTISTALLLSSKMAATASSSSVEGDYDPNEIKSGWVRKLRSIYQFTRPHTIRGTILASIAGTTRVILDIGPKSVFTNLPWISIIPKAFIGVIALLLGNAFIVGINQIYDKDIDIMNKPYLPIASGEMSKQYAWILTILSVIIGPILVYTNFPILLFQLYSIGILLGYLYSVPPFRTKRNPIAAALTIACVRGLFLNFGVYYAVLNALRPNIPFIWSPKVAFISRFMTLYAVIIAITKDLPDVEGDKAYQIESFATKYGVDNMAKGAAICLFGNYIHAIITGLILPTKFNLIPMIGGHTILASLLIYHYKQLKSNTMSSIKLYYKHIWDLFYLEYALYTLI